MSTQPVEVIHFTKPCPHCGKGLTTIKKFSGPTWLECENKECPFLTKQEQPVLRRENGVAIVFDEFWEPSPFTCGRMGFR